MAGEFSAKGRVYAQQLIDSPATPFGSSLGHGLMQGLKTAEKWQEYYNLSIRPMPTEANVTPLAECRSGNGDGTFLWKFGYESAMPSDVMVQPGSKINKFVPDPKERGQPAIFHPGVNHASIIVRNGPANLRWWLTRGTTADFTNVQTPPPPPCDETVGIDARTPATRVKGK